jgi:hypothetical protein
VKFSLPRISWTIGERADGEINVPSPPSPSQNLLRGHPLPSTSPLSHREAMHLHAFHHVLGGTADILACCRPPSETRVSSWSRYKMGNWTYCVCLCVLCFATTGVDHNHSFTQSAFSDFIHGLRCIACRRSLTPTDTDISYVPSEPVKTKG